MKNLIVMIVLAIMVVGCSEKSEIKKVKVLSGDSLWAITEATGNPGYKWEELMKANPHLPKPKVVKGKVIVHIKPGEVLNLPQGWSFKGTGNNIVEPVKTKNPFWEWLKNLWNGFWNLLVDFIKWLFPTLKAFDAAIVDSDFPDWLEWFLRAIYYVIVILVAIMLLASIASGMIVAVRRFLIILGNKEKESKTEGTIIVPNYQKELSDNFGGNFTTRKF